MKNGLREIKKHIKIYGLFIKNNLSLQMEYRFNFMVNIGIEVAYLLLKLIYVVIVFRTGLTINGFTPDAILIFVGTYTMMTGLYWGLFANNFMSISGHINSGTLDLAMVKPVSLQFLLTLRKIDFGLPIPNLLGGIAMIVIGWVRLGISVSIGNVLGFIGMLCISLILTYAIFLLPQLLAFKLIRMNAINNISNAMWDFNNMPMMIYSKVIQRIGIYAIPIFIISNFPPLFIMGRLEIYHIAWAIIVPMLCLVIVRLVWHIAIRSYSSASS